MVITSMENAYSLKGKNAIITGGNKGIGYGISTAFAQQGASIAIMARDEVTGKKVVDELTEKYGGKYAFYKLDISSMENCKTAVEKAIADFGNIDILVNNAGIGPTGNVLDMDENMTDWFKCMDIDLNGAVRMTYHAGKHMRDFGKGGRIINITSNAGEVCSKSVNMAAYCTAKAGMNMFTKGMACELARFGIRVNAIAPGFTYSNLLGDMPEFVLDGLKKSIPVGRLGQPIEIGALATYLASDASDNMTGAVLTIDGGHSLAI